jgi:2-polyprenyl-6-methoxyphenol hydroxylase-like FAD-dependent oxidoreductase
MASKIRNDGLWRVSYAEVPGLTQEQYRARQAEIFERILPGNPKAHEYKLAEDVSPARLHQRCVETMRHGRFILAGDSAHLCNPS